MNGKAGAKEKAASGLAACRGLPPQRAQHHLLRLVERFSPCWLLRLLLAPPLPALARPLCPALSRLLALVPLPVALLRPDEEDDDFELRDAIDDSLSSMLRPAHHARGHRPTLGMRRRDAVGARCALR
jgi:hypothetical protein